MAPRALRQAAARQARPDLVQARDPWIAELRPAHQRALRERAGVAPRGWRERLVPLERRGGRCGVLGVDCAAAAAGPARGPEAGARSAPSNAAGMVRPIRPGGSEAASSASRRVRVRTFAFALNGKPSAGGAADHRRSRSRAAKPPTPPPGFGRVRARLAATASHASARAPVQALRAVEPSVAAFVSRSTRASPRGQPTPRPRRAPSALRARRRCRALRRCGRFCGRVGTCVGARSPCDLDRPGAGSA
jgi:hypothetical protein